MNQRRAKATELLPGEARAAAGKPIVAFDARHKVNGWLAANEPRRVIAPVGKHEGWGSFIAEVRAGVHDGMLFGEHVEIILHDGAVEGTRNSVRSLGREMLERGAKLVECQGRRIYPYDATTDPRQSNLFGGR